MFLSILWLLLATPSPQATSPSVEQLVEHGYSLAQKGEMKGAEQELRQAVKLAPENALALAVLGMILSRGSRLEEACFYLGKALSIDPSDTGTRYNLAVNQARIGKLQAAQANLKLILMQKPGYKQAAALLESLESKSPYDAALDKYRAGDFAGSQAILENWLATGGRDSKTFSLLAWCFHRQGRTEASLIAMKQAIDLAPSDCSLYSQSGQILLEVRNFPAATGAVTKALEISPNYVPALKLKGLLAIRQGDLKQAESTFKKAIQLDPADPEALEGLGAVLGMLFQYAEAVATFEKGISRFPSYPRQYESYGRLLLEAGAGFDADAETRAATLFETALKLDGRLPQTHYELGRLMLQKGKPDEALRHLETAARLEPKDSKVHLALANAYRLLKRPAEQAKELQVFRELEAHKGH